jgi:hypothetical protein
VAGAVLLAAGLAVLPELPGTGAGPEQVFTFFLDQGDEVRGGAAVVALALLLVAVLLATLRATLAADAPVASVASFGLGLLAVGLQAFAAAALVTLATRAEAADPATSRSLLDLAEMTIGISGLAFALALATVAIAGHRGAGALPSSVWRLAGLAAIGCALWAGRLFTDSGALAADAFLGSTLGWLLLLSWVAVTGVNLIGGRRAGARPHPEPDRGETEQDEEIALQVVRERIRIRTGRRDIG